MDRDELLDLAQGIQKHGHRHHTWAKTYWSYPKAYFQPTTVEEVQLIVKAAARERRRLVVVGSGHSPSDLTCSSSWMVNLDKMNKVLSAGNVGGDGNHARVLRVQAGIRLRDLNVRAKEHGLTLPNLGSVDEQSFAGAIATGTHGSSLQHGPLSECVRRIRIVLASGEVVWCSPVEDEDQQHQQQKEDDDNDDDDAPSSGRPVGSPDLFRAALVSLGALGIVVELELEMTAAADLIWTQTVQSLDHLLTEWDAGLWSQAEYVRVWWLPYQKRAVIWQGDRADPSPGTERQGQPISTVARRLGRRLGSVWASCKEATGSTAYYALLVLGHQFPRLLPFIEWLAFGFQVGFRIGSSSHGRDELRRALLMNCFYSQLVNEWALPIDKGPEVIRRLTSWLHDDQVASGIPVGPHGVYVHAPIEVRVCNSDMPTPSSATHPVHSTRAFLDNTCRNGPTIFFNATLYRPFLSNPHNWHRYYQAVEFLMKELGGKPHWAKNFSFTTADDIAAMYNHPDDSDGLPAWLRVRKAVDPNGMFAGPWHRRYVLSQKESHLPFEELEAKTGNHWPWPSPGGSG